MATSSSRPLTGPGLTLTRRVGEVIYIGRDIAVTVQELSRTQVKLHFTAPKHVGISRAELGIETHLKFVNEREVVACTTPTTTPGGKQ